MERIVARGNMRDALKRVRRNKGKPGVDGMTVGKDMTAWLIGNWERVKGQLLSGDYQPQAVLRCEIPKESGGTRTLGIPSVHDRLIQQAVLQVLQPLFDPTFSPHSYGFRPKKQAHQAVIAAQRFIEEGKTWVVDVDLEKFFDRVNHDILMGKLAKRIEDKRLLRLIRRYLEAGMMADGVVTERIEGTPQGGPLSPLLANVMLDEVDKELEKRQLSFARYADDCNVYVGSERAAQRAMESLRKLYGRLKLTINAQKSAVAPPWNRKFLGFSFYRDQGRVKRKIAAAPLAKFKAKVRKLTGRNTRLSFEYVIRRMLGPYLTGWKGYFQLEQTATTFRKLDAWIRRRVRQLIVHEWKTFASVFRNLVTLGIRPKSASYAGWRRRRSWYITNHPAVTEALSEKYLRELGLPSLCSK